jgi:carboxyl-terminal processing protease
MKQSDCIQAGFTFLLWVSISFLAAGQEVASQVSLKAQPYRVSAQGNTETCQLAKQMIGTLRTYHVDPPADNQLFSDRFFQQFVHHLDPKGLYLLETDLALLQPLFANAEQSILAGECNALQQAVAVYSRQYNFVDSVRQQLLRKPLKLKQDTFLMSLNVKPSYAVDKNALTKRWQKQLAYLLLYEASTEAGEGALSLVGEDKLRKKVQERLQCRRTRMMQTPGGIEGYVGEQFLQALATTFDPHTNYMPVTQRDQFVASLSSQTESFGIVLDENQQGDIQIARLVPGGPAWRTNELHEGDVLLHLRPKKGLPKEFACMRMEEADALMGDAAIQQAYLTVRKQNGQIKTVELIKEKLQVEENVVSSMILEGERPIGYLSLPSFYSQMDASGFSRNATGGAASDVAKALVQLKKAGVEGIILDLRFNGGGSVMEALNLAGIFIDEGPLGVEVTRGEKPRLMKDLNRGVLYGAPLIVLVNGLSASASEIMALALQEYHRALIVGSPTYGKATIQVVMPVGGQTAASTTTEPYLKVTIGKYYGVNATSYQTRGVQPDVVLADGLGAFNLSESAYPTSLRADVVDKKVLYKALPPLPLAEVAARSQARLRSDTAYAIHKKRSEAFAKAGLQGYPLRLQEQYFKEDYAQLIKLTEEGTSTSGLSQNRFQTRNLPALEALLQGNALNMEQNQRFREELAQDVWLAETYSIMLDLISLQKPKQTSHSTTK